MRCVRLLRAARRSCPAHAASGGKRRQRGTACLLGGPQADFSSQKPTRSKPSAPELGAPLAALCSDAQCYLPCDVLRRLPVGRQERERLSSGTLQRPLVEHLLAGGADLPLDLVRDPRALAQSVLDDRSVPVTPTLPVHLHLRVMTTATRTKLKDGEITPKTRDPVRILQLRLERERPPTRVAVAVWRNRDTLLGLRLAPHYLCPRRRLGDCGSRPLGGRGWSAHRLW